MGRHVNHPDTSRLPFSYLIENHGDSFLVPGVNLRSVGTIRDAQKWPRRDKRRDPDLLDSINFNLLSPYTVGKMMSGIKLLNDLERTAGLTADRFAFQTMTIDARALRKGRGFYRMAIDKFMGNSVIHRLGKTPIESDESLRARLRPTHAAGEGKWVDVCGLFAPKSEIDALCAQLADGSLASLEELEARWKALHADYFDMEWTWVASHLEARCGKTVETITRADIVAIVERWRESVVMLDRMLLDDAAKEYSLTSRTGFGIDSPDEDADEDFNNVRGDFDSDPFVLMVKEHIEKKSALGDQAISLVEN